MDQADLDEITSLEQRIREQAAEIVALRRELNDMDRLAQEQAAEIAALREDRGRLTALVARLEEWINYLTENMLRPGGAAETPLREIDALRGRIREAYSMLRPPSFTLLGEIYKPVIRRPELERWEATPEVQRALGEEPKP